MSYTGLHLAQEITVSFTFRVTDEQAIRQCAAELLTHPAYRNMPDPQTAPLDDLVDFIIGDRMGGWFDLGLERVDD